MHIIHVAAEMAPTAKVGGLGDVILGLSRQTVIQGNEVSVILPKYDCMDLTPFNDLKVYAEGVKSFYQNEWHENTVWTGTLDNIRIYLIDPHHHRNFFNRGCFYGCIDDLERYIYFSRCCADFLHTSLGWPDIIHLHDWQSAAIAVLFKDHFNRLNELKTKIVMTIHNISYQGLCSPNDLKNIGLTEKNYVVPELIQDSFYPEAGNLLKAAIIYSDFVTTVSPSYAKEVLHREFGMGLEDTLQKNLHKFKGILNGIDYVYWNPETDPFIPLNFSANNPNFPVENKDLVKKVLRDRLLLAQSKKPLVACITRLVPQKGIELIKHIITHAEQLRIQFILLGVCPIPKMSEELHRLRDLYDKHPDIHLNLYHRDELAHMIYAASDMFIVPSLFEPCGLTQMIAFRYGTIPIVRNTGGLHDTVFDVEFERNEPNRRNGYSFDEPTAAGIEWALSRAVSCWYNKPEEWKQLKLNGMKIDFSWEKPTVEYINVYKSMGFQ